MILPLFLLGPLAELVVTILVARQIGVLNTLALLIIISFAGAILMKREGLGAYRRFQAEAAAGKAPTGTAIDGFLIVLGGILMVVPGFISGAFGLLLLLPPVRALARGRVAKRTEARARASVTIFDAQGRPVHYEDPIIPALNKLPPDGPR